MIRALVGKAVLALWLAAGGLCVIAQAAAAQPEPAALPAQRVDTAMPAAQGETITVGAGASFQHALDRAKPGDVIELEAGAEFRGPFTLPKKSGDAWIVIRSSAHAALPPSGTRIEPDHARQMPALSAAAGSHVVKAAPGAHHYRFIGIEIRPARGEFVYNVVELGDGSEQQAALPHHFVFDRCYVHGDAEAGARRGLALNGAHTAVIDSHFSDFKEQGADTQALAGWNGPGPFLIQNNHLEAAGENIMFGGATPGIRDLVPADIEVRGNYLTKSLTWKADEPGFNGKQWSVKNLFELKNARRVLVDGNVMEHNWTQGQNGIAILFTIRNEGGAAPWAVVEDVTFTNNLIKGVAGGFNILARDDNGKPSGQAARIVIRNNVFSDMGGKWGNAPLFQILNGASDLTIERNTALNGDRIVMTEGEPNTNVAFRGNIFRNNQYGIIGTGTGPGQQTLERYFPEAQVTNNAIIGGRMSDYPDGNFFPVADTEVGFLDKDAGDLRLDPAHSFRRGETNDTGADMSALCAALAPVDSSRHCPRDGQPAR